MHSQSGSIAADLVTVEDFAADHAAPWLDRSPEAIRHAPLDRVLRAFDLAAAAALILWLSPLLLAITFALKLGGGPVLFSQDRVGRHDRSFRCFKFRTMVPDAEQRLAALLAADPLLRAEWEADRKLRRDPRVTWVGRILRRLSFDELPQLINVIRGEMSLVGPRPIVRSEVALYGRYIAFYYQIRPGLTGLWQVSGRNDVSYRRRVALDVSYARYRSAALYFYVLLRTPRCVLTSRGCY